MMRFQWPAALVNWRPVTYSRSPSESHKWKWGCLMATFSPNWKWFISTELDEIWRNVTNLFWRIINLLCGGSAKFKGKIFLKVVQSKKVDFIIQVEVSWNVRRWLFQRFELLKFWKNKLSKVWRLNLKVKIRFLITLVRPSIISSLARLTSSTSELEQRETRFCRTPSSTYSISFFRYSSITYFDGWKSENSNFWINNSIRLSSASKADETWSDTFS